MDVPINETMAKYLLKVLQYFDRRSLEKFRSCKESELNAYHFTLGVYIRNSLLDENGELYRLFIENGIKDKDSIKRVLLMFA